MASPTEWAVDGICKAPHDYENAALILNAKYNLKRYIDDDESSAEIAKLRKGNDELRLKVAAAKAENPAAAALARLLPEGIRATERFADEVLADLERANAELEKSQKRCATLEQIIGGAKGAGKSLNLDDLNNLDGDKRLEKLASEAQSLKEKLSNTGLSREMAMGAFVGSARQVGMTPQGYTVTVPDVPKRTRTDAGDAEIGRMRAEMDALRAENSKLRANYQGLSSQFIQLATQFASSQRPETPTTPSARPANTKPEDGYRVDEEMDDLDDAVDRAVTPLPDDDEDFIAQAVYEVEDAESITQAVAQLQDEGGRKND